MNSENQNLSTEDFLIELKNKLPENWPSMSEDLRLHHLMKATNEVLKPLGSWVLVNADMTLLELIGEKSNV